MKLKFFLFALFAAFASFTAISSFTAFAQTAFCPAPDCALAAPDSSSAPDYIESCQGLNIKMVYVEAGSFDLSSETHVTLDAYYISATEITQSQWETVMGTNIYDQRKKADPSWKIRGVGPDYPVYYVDWSDATAFCQKLSEITGKTYLLPTEAQWEFAARGGKKQSEQDAGCCAFSGSNAVDSVAWYIENSGDSTHPVAQLRPNELGLYDMSGNVWEWCRDWYGAYEKGSLHNPTGPSSGQRRVLRGGSWGSPATSCCISNYRQYAHSERDSGRGFRIVRLP